MDTDWKTQFIYDLLPVLGPREKESPDGGSPGKYVKNITQRSIRLIIDFDY